MSLKAKLEAVIYASEEPVTLGQLAVLFAADALEWKAAEEAAAREQTAEVAGEAAVGPLPLIDQGLEYLGLADSPEVYANEPPRQAEGSQEGAESPAPGKGEPGAPAASDQAVVVSAEAGYAPIVMKDDAVKPAPEEAAGATAPDAEAESRRLARQRDRDVKGVLKQLLDELIAGYSANGHGVEIREIAGGYRMATKPECHDAVRLFVKSLKPPLKLSLPALETLAVIAYKQPVTAPEVTEIRGVESSGVLGSLLARKLIATAGRKQVIGRPILYKTTKEFLLRFGLKDVSELPSMEEFEKMAATELELEPEAAEYGETPGGEAEIDEEAGAVLESNSQSGEELDGTKEAVKGSAAAGEVAGQASAGPEQEPGGMGDIPAASSSPEDAPRDGAETEALRHAEANQEEGRPGAAPEA